MFIGANIDAIETAESIGIGRNRAANYKRDRRGTDVLYEQVSRIASNVRFSRVVGAKYESEMESILGDIEADYAARKDEE